MKDGIVVITVLLMLVFVMDASPVVTAKFLNEVIS